MQKHLFLLFSLAIFSAVSAQKAELHLNLQGGQSYTHHQYGNSFRVDEDNSDAGYAYGGSIQALFPLSSKWYLGGEIGIMGSTSTISQTLISYGSQKKYLFLANYYHRQLQFSIIPEYRFPKRQFLYLNAGPTFIVDLRSRFGERSTMYDTDLTDDNLNYSKKQYSAGVNLAFTAGLGIRASITDYFLLKGGLRFTSTGISQWNEEAFLFHFGTIALEMGCVFRL